MELKGYLHADGRVRQVKDGSIGTVYYKETRYNLRRVLVSRDWIVELLSGHRLSGATRKEVVVQAIAQFEFDQSDLGQAIASGEF